MYFDKNRVLLSDIITMSEVIALELTLFTQKYMKQVFHQNSIQMGF